MAMPGGGSLRAQVAQHVSKSGSIKSAMSKMKKSQIPTDVGFLPGTLVHPLPGSKPALFSRKTFFSRLKVESSAYLGPIKSMIGEFTQRDPPDPVTGLRPKRRFMLSERYYAARNLHYRLYKAMAEGNRSELEKIACTGIQRQAILKLDTRKAQRKPDEEWSMTYRGFTPKEEMNKTVWAWFKQFIVPPWFKSTRMVSDMCLPLVEGVKIRQVVVQIKGKQTLDRKDGSPVKTIDSDEYVVIQKFFKEGKEEDWMIWGTTQRSNKRAVDDILKQTTNTNSERGSKWDQIKSSFTEKMGNMPQT